MATIDMTKGPTIALVGPRAGGKSSLGRRLATELRQEGRSVTLTRAPGGSAGAEAIRRLVLEEDTEWCSPTTKLFLLTAALREQLEKTIWPARSSGEIVITDQYLDDIRAPLWAEDQGLQQPIEHAIALAGIPEADLTILVDVDPNVAAERIAAAARQFGEFVVNRDELEERTIRGRYLVLAKNNKLRLMVVDGNRSPEAVYRDLRSLLEQKFGF